jgi:hypothetical protein
MAELTIRLETDPATGKPVVIIRYRSDEDALPLEHEEEHRRLVAALVQRGLVPAGQTPAIVVEREGTGAPAAPAEATADAERRGVKQGG